MLYISSPRLIYFLPVKVTNLKIVSLDLCHLFHSSPYSFSSANHMFILCIYDCFCFVTFVLFFQIPRRSKII